MQRPLVLAALVWVPFLSIFWFANQGDRSHPHLAFHVFALALLVPATVLAWRLRRSPGSRFQRAVAWVLAVTVPASVVGHVLEFGVALTRYAADGWVDRNTSDIWVSGPHAWAADLTVAAMLTSMIGSLALVVATALHRRSSRGSRVEIPVGPAR